MILVYALLVALLFFVVREIWREEVRRRRAARQAKCREWIEWKLKEQSAVGYYEAQCAFRALVADPEWDARGPWEWEEKPARSRLARELWPHDKGMWH